MTGPSTHVSDVATAKAVYAALLGIQPQGMTSPVASWHVSGLEAKLAEVTAAGATVKEPAHRNVLGLLQDR